MKKTLFIIIFLIMATAIVIAETAEKIEIKLDEKIVEPGESLSYKIAVYDSENNEIGADVKIILTNANPSFYLEKTIKANEPRKLNLENGATAGYWKMDATSNNLKSQELFFVKEKEQAIFEIQKNVLTITNTGNVLYGKTIQIIIGNDIQLKKIDLDIGEAKKLRLIAPDGNYKVKVTDGEETLTKENVALTGKFLGVVGERPPASILKKYSVVWIFLLFVFGIFIYASVKKPPRRRKIK